MEYIYTLGTSGTLSGGRGATCFKVSFDTLIDAGNIIASLEESAIAVEHIYLTHSHFDHIVDIPALLDLFYDKRTKALHIYALKETISALRDSLFNGSIFPDYTQIPLANNEGPSLIYHTIEYNTSYRVSDKVTLVPFATEHTVVSCGYIVKGHEKSIMITADTASLNVAKKALNDVPMIETLVTEVSFPSRLEERALVSGHMTPDLLLKELQGIERKQICILVTHLKPDYYREIRDEINSQKFSQWNIGILDDGDVVPFGNLKVKSTIHSIKEQYAALLNTGIALSEEKDTGKLSAFMLNNACMLTRADAGTLYILSKDKTRLEFMAVRNNTLEEASAEIWEDIPLYHPDGSENHSLAASYCALSKMLCNIDNMRNGFEGMSFDGTQTYDSESGYKTRTMLVVPLLDHESNLLGVLQLINKLDDAHTAIPFDTKDEKIISSLGSQTSLFLMAQKLITDMDLLFESFLESIALALDKKSPHMKGHVNRVADLTLMLAKAIDADRDTFHDISYSKGDLKVIEIAALMHDVGKITTPAYLLEKSKKLEMMMDRMELIRLRFQFLKAAKIEADITQEEIDAFLVFLEQANCGQEYFTAKEIDKIKHIAGIVVDADGEKIPLLTESEVEYLSIVKGTLTKEEREAINQHATMSIEMLNSIKFPEKYMRVPEIAGNHHERPNGKGYPRGLKSDQISFESKILAIADIFEAVTASDRPYKKPNSLSTSMKTMLAMANNGDIDRDIFMFFYREKIYLDYAKKYMSSSLVDPVELEID